MSEESRGSRLEVVSASMSSSEIETQKTVYEGMLSMQHSLYSYAIKQKYRLDKLTELISKLEDRIFDEAVLETLPPKELMKFLTVLRASQLEVVQFLERLFKLTLNAQDVLAMARKLGIADEVLDHVVRGKFKIDPVRASMIRELLLQSIAMADSSSSEQSNRH